MVSGNPTLRARLSVEVLYIYDGAPNPPAPPEILFCFISVTRFLNFIVEIAGSPAPPAVNNWAAATYSQFLVLFLIIFSIFGAPGGVQQGAGSVRRFWSSLICIYLAL